MNDRSVKPKQAVAAKEKGRPRSGEYARTSNMDDEFHEFFNQGDVGEYEGGVAYSQPPSRLLPEPEVDEQIVITDPSRQRARRAFFGRVVAIIVGACVVVLVTAARFRPQDIRKDNENDARHASVQFAQTEEVKLSPPPKEQPRALPLVPAVAAVVSALPQAAVIAAAPPPPEANQPQAIDPGERPPAGKTAAQGAKNSDLLTVEIAHAPEKQAPPTAAPAAKVSRGSAVPSKLSAKSKAIATREAHPPATGVSKPVKESVGAFPVD